MKTSILSILIICGVLSADCTRMSNDIVSCSENQLVWQDDNGTIDVKKVWSEAITYCEDLSFAGYSDWRLPNQNELLSIVDYDKHDSAINSAFKNTYPNYYWSSTIRSDNSNNAWLVNFNDGGTFILDSSKDNNNSRYVRCVRDAN